jgi:hypothetical protein
MSVSLPQAKASVQSSEMTTELPSGYRGRHRRTEALRVVGVEESWMA